MVDLLEGARTHWFRLLAQWQDQARLRMAGWLILALLALNLVMLCSDWREARRLDFIESAKNLAKLQELAGQGYWPERAVQAEDVLANFRTRLWRAQNPALARADVQAWLDALVKKTGLQEARVNVLQPLDFEDGKRTARIEAQLRARFDAESFGRLLYAVEGAPQWVSIDAIEIGNRVSPSINLQLSFHFLPDPRR
ncbi:GspMb/PilO family protein [Pseudomonas jinjuensis]|uniref:Type II secretion system (T2SS), protein M subtype b n=1 Tax=Pseudomonas jinjuensis TaxID=198616 RepID=A0A1G9YGF1_9PSED|nr:GspMb/PilO family protein [Pseudomonas jinjuensis]SDN07581.1 Type II secretion system (T2SS), protein M subtype b [Pseudomonas jinjuensis]